MGVTAGILVGFEPQHLGVAYVELGVFEQLVVVIVKFFEALFYYVAALRVAVDGKVGLNARLHGIPAEYAHAHGVYGAYPHIGGVPAYELHPLLHFGGSLVCKGDGKYLPRGGEPLPEYVGYARGENARLAAARARKHEHGALCIFYRLYLFRIEFIQQFVHVLNYSTQSVKTQ